MVFSAADFLVRHPDFVRSVFEVVGCVLDYRRESRNGDAM